MRKFPKGVVALALCAVVLLAGVSLAANTVTIKVLQRGNPVEGAVVQVVGSDGATNYVTDNHGVVTATLSGTFFRLKVNEQLQPGGHWVSEHQVIINLN